MGSRNLEHFQQKCEAVFRPEMRLEQEMGAAAGERKGGTGRPVEGAAAYRPLFFSLISLTRL